MTNQDYERALQAAHKELAEIATERAKLDARIIRLTKTIDTLKSLIRGDSEDSDEAAVIAALPDIERLGITDAIREIVWNNAAPMTPPQVKDALLLAGFEKLREYSNPLAAVHAVLRRLKESDHLDEIPLADGKKAYGKSIKRRMVEAFANYPPAAHPGKISLLQQLLSERENANKTPKRPISYMRRRRPAIPPPPGREGDK